MIYGKRETKNIESQNNLRGLNLLVLHLTMKISHLYLVWEVICLQLPSKSASKLGWEHVFLISTSKLFYERNEILCY